MDEPIDLSAARAALLAKQAPPEPVPTYGGWRFKVVRGEVLLRNTRLPHLRLDLTTTEAADLHEALGAAVFDSLTMPVVRVSLWRRFGDWLARRTWRKKHAAEQAAALKELADDFARTGGW